MKKVLFLCHGNICRSPMAEFIFKDMVNKSSKSFNYHIISRATSTEEIGNDIHYGTKAILDKYHIPYHTHFATQITRQEYDEYDYIIAMDHNNINNLKYLLGTNDKANLLLSYNNSNNSIRDPWYTGNFEETYEDIVSGLTALFIKLENKKEV